MTVHFFYNYKDDLVKKLQEHYHDDIIRLKAYQEEQKQLDEAEKTIWKYFDDVTSTLKDVIEASGGEVALEKGDDFILKFNIMENFIKFTRRDNNIEVKIGYFVPDNNIVESLIIGYIVTGDKRCKTKKVGKIHDGSNFDENTLNYYMRTAFKGIVELHEEMDA